MSGRDLDWENLLGYAINLARAMEFPAWVEAEDVGQTAMARLTAALHEYRSELGDIVSFSRTVVKNAVINELNRIKRIVNNEPPCGDVDDHEDELGVEPDTDTKLLTEKLLASINRNQKKVIELYYFKEYTQDEIAEMMGISRIAVLNIINRALKTMRKASGEASLA